jgi:[ribosomal protein S5]-alanine N-acetyltransferase
MIVSETARLRLRELQEGDAAFVFELYSDPDFLANIGDRGVHSLEAARRYIDAGPRASYQRHGFGLWLVELSGDCSAVGVCGLLRRDSHPDVELGFALLPRFRRMGYTREAASAVLQLATRRLGLTRIVALVASGNHPSMRLLEQLGFRFERHVRFTAAGESQLFALQTLPQSSDHASVTETR